MKLNFTTQLILALVGVFSVLAIVQGILMTTRAQQIAQAEEVVCNVELDPALIEQGQVVYAQNCAACHGQELQGASNWETQHEDGSWPPPPLNSAAHAWQHSDSSIVSTITSGRSAGKTNPMPAFGEILSESEIRAVIEFIKSNWGANELNQQDLLNPGSSG